jgi:putative aldouronate transport system substrate-binding protein
MKKKTTVLALSLALSLSLLAGCSGNNNSSPEASSSAEASNNEQETQGYNGIDNLKITDKPTTITMFSAFGGNGAPKGDMPAWIKTAEITNVSMENVANESISDELQSFNTMLASGKLPDFIHALRSSINPVITQGAFIPLDDLIEQHAPNIKKFLEDFPEARRAGSGPDGKIYSITGTLGGEPGKALPSTGFFVRQDWLDKLNLQAPATLEDYKKVLYAFRDQDPNGNGKKDEIPFFYRDKGIWPLLQLWNAHTDWYVGADDKVHYGKVDPEYQTAMKELAQWYKDGVVDPEIFTRGAQARQFLLGNNVGGSTIDWFASTSAVNDAVKEQVPGINFAAIAPPADDKGIVKMDQSREPIHAYAWGISKDAKDPVTVIEYLDFFFSEVGNRLMSLGIEGQDYDMKDGQPVIRDSALKNPTGFPNYLRSIGAGYDIGRRGSLVGEINSMNAIGKAGFELYEKSSWLSNPFPVLTFTEEEKKAIDDATVNLKPYTDEYEQKVLMGAQEIDSSWESHLSEINKMGYQQALDAYNSAYERFKTEVQ